MKSTKIENKLIKIERIINTYLKNKDEPIEEINIDKVPFNKLKEIVSPKKDDPFLYDGYILEPKQLEKINKILRNKIVPNFELYFYVLESSGIYDW